MHKERNRKKKHFFFKFKTENLTLMHSTKFLQQNSISKSRYIFLFFFFFLPSSLPPCPPSPFLPLFLFLPSFLFFLSFFFSSIEFGSVTCQRELPVAQNRYFWFLLPSAPLGPHWRSGSIEGSDSSFPTP